MKIEVDLEDIFRDDEGNPEESMQESIKRQVIEVLSAKFAKGLNAQIDAQVSEVIGTKLKEVADELLPRLAADMIDAEYQPYSRYGEREEKTTFRKQLVKVVSSSLVYKREQYSSDTNVFTKTVDAVIAENMKAFQAEFNKLVTDKFRAEALAYAVASLKKALGIDKG